MNVFFLAYFWAISERHFPLLHHGYLGWRFLKPREQLLEIRQTFESRGNFVGQIILGLAFLPQPWKWKTTRKKEWKLLEPFF